MSLVPASLSSAWQARTPRERQMLALMFVALAMFLYWFALAAPLRAWANAAETRHARAVAEQAAALQVVDALATLPPASVQSPRPRAESLAESARALGLTVREARDEADGQARLTLGPAAPDLLFAWIEQQRLAGAGPRGVSLSAGDAGLEAELRF